MEFENLFVDAGVQVCTQTDCQDFTQSLMLLC